MPGFHGDMTSSTASTQGGGAVRRSVIVDVAKGSAQGEPAAVGCATEKISLSGIHISRTRIEGPGHIEMTAMMHHPLHETAARSARSSRISEKWSMLVVMLLWDGPRHGFNDIRRSTGGISQQMLTAAADLDEFSSRRSRRSS